MRISFTFALFMALFLGYVQSCNKGGALSLDLCAGQECALNMQCASNSCIGFDINNNSTGFCSLESYQVTLIVIGSIVFCAGAILGGVCCHRRRKLRGDLHHY